MLRDRVRERRYRGKSMGYVSMEPLGGVDDKKRGGVGARLLLVLSFVAILLVGGFYVVGQANADTFSNMSFARLTSAAAAYFDQSTNLAVPKSERPWLPSGDGMNAGQAGVLVGYQDDDWDNLPFVGWIISDLTSGAQGRSYVGTTAGDASIHQAVEQYMAYGFMLNDLGLDSTANQSFDIMLVARAISGFPVLLAYITSLSVDLIFSFVIWLLLFLNPFAWFMGPGSVIQSSGFGNYLTEANSADSLGLFSGIQSTVTDIYNLMSDMAWSVIVPIFFVVTVVSLVLFASARKNAGTKIRKFATYALFIMIGIPLLGSTYTSALYLMGDAVGLDTSTKTLRMDASGMMDSTYVIASTFCDFEGWASRTNLSWPSNAEATVTVQNNDSLAVTRQTSTRTLCRLINSRSGLGVTVGSMTSEDYAVNGTDSAKWNSAALDTDGNVNITGQTIIPVINMLLRYMGGSFYTSADYESSVKAQLSANDSGAEENALAESMKTFNNYENWGDQTLSPPWLNDGELRQLVGSGSYTAAGNRMGTMLEASGDTSHSGREVKFTRPGSLSTLSTYNYLRTTFEASSVNVFQPDKQVNLGSNPAHRSVNLIGNGLMIPLYWANALIMMLVLTIIGWAYAFPILFNNIRRCIQMVIAVPFAMIGMLKSAARVVTLTFMMILEIFVTIFAYQIVKVLLMSINNIVEVQLAGGFNSLFGSLASMAALTSPLMVIIGVVFNIWFCIMAVRLRKSLVKTVDEAMASVVNRLFATDAPMPTKGGPGILASAAGAVGTGAAMAATQGIGGAVRDAAGGKIGQVMSGSAGDGGEGGTGGAGGTTTVIGGLPPSGGIEGASAHEAVVNGKSSSAPAAGSTDAYIAAYGADGQLKGGGSAGAAAVPDVAGNGEIAKSQDAIATKADGQIDTKQVRTDNKVDELTGKVDAVQSETNKEAADKMAQQQKISAAKDAAVGAAKTVKGVGEGVAAYSTGNPELAKSAIKDVSGGVSQTAGAAKKGATAKQNAQTTVAVQQRQQTAANQAVSKAPSASSGAASGIAGQGIQSSGSTKSVTKSTQTTQTTPAKAPQQKVSQQSTQVSKSSQKSSNVTNNTISATPMKKTVSAPVHKQQTPNAPAQGASPKSSSANTVKPVQKQVTPKKLTEEGAEAARKFI